LITKRDLKKGYLVAWWGRRIGKKRLPAKNWEWALESRRGVIDAVPFRRGSQLQFCQCPGPSEKPSIDYAKPGVRDALLANRPKMCLLFATLCDIPKGHQITMMYNKDEKTTQEFFEERGLVRANVSAPKCPALKKTTRK